MEQLVTVRKNLTRPSFVDQLSLPMLCHSKLGPLHPQSAEVLTCKWATESSPKHRNYSKTLPGLEMVPQDDLFGMRGREREEEEMQTAQTEVCLTV